MGARSLRNLALSSDDLGGERVHVEEWGEDAEFFVRGLTASERNAVIKCARNDEGTVDLDTYYAMVVQLTAYDPDDLVNGSLPDGAEPVFSPDDVPLLLQKSSRAMDKLSLPAMRLSGLTKEDLKEAVADAGKDFSATQSGDSIS